MGLTLIVVGVLCLAATCVSSDNCATYGPVQRKFHECKRSYQSFSISSFGNSSEALHRLQMDCSNAELVYECMADFTDDCDNITELNTEIMNSMNFCNGNTVADWAKELIRTDQFSRNCVLVEREDFCSGPLSTFARLVPFDNMTESVQQGLIELKQLKQGLMNCFFDEFLSTPNEHCVSGSRVETLVGTITIFFGLSRWRPLGVYLNDYEILALETLLQSDQTVQTPSLIDLLSR